MNNKKSGNLAVLIICIIFYLALFALQGQFARNGLNALNGILAQVGVLLCTVMVVTNRKRGFIIAMILNLINAATVVVQIFSRGGSAGASSLPGVLVALVTIITLFVLYTYLSRSEKAHDELTESYNQLIEANRVQEEQAAALRTLAYTDRLTGLPNRAAFNESLAAKVEQAQPFMVMLMDADDFKQINDNFGHDVGDALIKEYSARFSKYCKGHYEFGKLGGDEYGMIIDGRHTEADILNLTEQLRTLFGEPFNVGGTNFSIAMSYGVASFPNDGTTAEALVSAADTALYNAKIGGKNRAIFFSEHTAG